MNAGDHEGARRELPQSPRMVMGASEDLGDALVRMAREQIDVMADGFGLESDDDLHDNAVHLARKAGKRLRALLRLGRPWLGSDTYHEAATEVRDRGRQLSETRLTKVLMDTLENIAGEVSEDEVTGLRQILVMRHERALARFRDDTAGRMSARRALGDLADRIGAALAAAPMEGAFAAVTPAVTRSYRNARRAMREAENLDSAVEFHEWRKRVNTLRYQLEALSGACAPPVAQLAVILEGLSELLGADHDLADLCALGDAVPERLRSTAMRTSRELREQSLQRGADVFARKPGAFARFLEGHTLSAR